MIKLLFIFFTAVVLSWLATYPLFLIRARQPIREEGPSSHQIKAGTPTLGGLGFIAVIFVLALILLDLELNFRYAAAILLMLFFAGIGLTDDLLKVRRGRNLGLTFWQKMCLQIFIAAIFAIFLTAIGHNLNVGGLLARMGFKNPYFYQILAVVMVVGAANAANLTDGLNGLLGGTAAIAFLSFAFLAGRVHAHEAVILSVISSGAISAFLYFNFPRAKIFMGDVGSLALGALLAGLAIVMHKELRLMIIGGVLVAEALSVIIQVVSYKLFKKRVFKMSPLHHHFELMGYKETTVVIGFWMAGAILGIIGAL